MAINSKTQYPTCNAPNPALTQTVLRLSSGDRSTQPAPRAGSHSLPLCQKPPRSRLSQRKDSSCQA